MKFKSQATSHGLDQRSQNDRESPKNERRKEYDATKTRKGTASMTKEHKFSNGNRGACVPKNVEMLRLQSEKRVDKKGTRKETTKDCRGHE